MSSRTGAVSVLLSATWTNTIATYDRVNIYVRRYRVKLVSTFLKPQAQD